jgi:hypothetical protein
MSNLPAGVTDREIDRAQLADDEVVPCAYCHASTDYESKGIVEVCNTLGTKYFCNNTCRSNMVWDETYTTSGRADLLRTVAALHLLMESDVLSRAPAITIYDADEVSDGMTEYSVYRFSEFRKMALSFLDVLSPDGCAWATEAQDMAGDFGGELSAKAVASFTKMANAVGKTGEAKVLDVTA